MNRVITISRQYGSGGRELGEKLAARLGIPFYDKELVGMIAREGNMETAVLEAYDEVEPDFDNYSLRDVPPDYQIAMTQKLYAAQCRVILDLAAKGPCVMVGRCADAILPDAIRLFVYAGMEQRRERISKLHPDLPGDQVEKRIISVDRKRKAYHEYYSTKDWGEMEGYDLCLNTGKTGVDGCLETALAYIKHVKD